MDFKELIAKTKQVASQFPRQYDERDHFIDLVEEVGELAQAMQISSGRKSTNVDSKRRTKEDVVDALCDVLFELIRLAGKMNIDLEQEYIKVLKHIQSRIGRGEFKESSGRNV